MLAATASVGVNSWIRPINPGHVAVGEDSSFDNLGGTPSFVRVDLRPAVVVSQTGFYRGLALRPGFQGEHAGTVGQEIGDEEPRAEPLVPLTHAADADLSVPVSKVPVVEDHFAAVRLQSQVEPGPYRRGAASGGVPFLAPVVLLAVPQFEISHPVEAYQRPNGQKIVVHPLARIVDFVGEFARDPRVAPLNGPSQIRGVADVGAFVDPQPGTEMTEISLRVHPVRRITQCHGVVFFVESGIPYDVLRRPGIARPAKTALHPPLESRKAVERSLQEEGSRPLFVVGKEIRVEPAAHSRIHGQLRRFDADYAPDGPGAVLHAGGALEHLDAGRCKGVDLGCVVSAPLLSFLGNPGVEYQHPGAVHAAHHGLRNGRSRGQGGYARQRLQRLAQRLATAFLQGGRWQDENGLAGPGEFARQVPVARDGDLLAEKRLRLHAHFKRLRFGFGDDHLAPDRPVADKPELDRVAALWYVFETEYAFFICKRTDFECRQNNGHRRQRIAALAQHLSAHRSGPCRCRKYEAGQDDRQDGAPYFRRIHLQSLQARVKWNRPRP